MIIKPYFFRMAQLGHRPLLEVNHVIHAGSGCVLPGRPDNISVCVIALDIHLDAVVHNLHRLVHRIVPVLRRIRFYQFPPPRRNGSMAWRNIGRNHGRLDREGSASAEGIHQNPVLLPGSQENQAAARVSVIGALLSAFCILFL